MKLLTARQMKELDNTAINKMGIPSTSLMTRAAEFVARAAMEFLPKGGKCAVFSGSGNNGGDGIAAAVALVKRGFKPAVFLVGDIDRLTPDSREMVRRLEEVGGRVEEFDEEQVVRYLKGCYVIIDAMFGIGLNSELRGKAKKAMELINASPARVVAADIASGVQADTGKLLGSGVKADVTVTFTCPKAGQYIEPGATYSGIVEVVDIGIPGEALAQAECNTYLVTGEDISLPERLSDTHKGDYGKLLIIGGSTGYTGAPVLAAYGAVRSGAGLVYLGVPEPIYEIVAAKCLEVMPYPLPSGGDGQLTEKALRWIFKKMKECDGVLVGPGLGRSAEVDEVVYQIIRKSSVPVIIDADGINAVSGNINVLDEADCPLILTPHEGEFKRLTGGKDYPDRLTAARDFAQNKGCVLVLKGPGTISAFPDGSAYINTTGNPGMAKGGSGDVLSGIITALVGQGMELKEAVFTAVWLHGKCGDLLKERLGSYAMLPGELADTLPEVLKLFER